MRRNKSYVEVVRFINRLQSQLVMLEADWRVIPQRDLLWGAASAKQLTPLMHFTAPPLTTVLIYQYICLMTNLVELREIPCVKPSEEQAGRGFWGQCLRP